MRCEVDSGLFTEQIAFKRQVFLDEFVADYRDALGVFLTSDGAVVELSKFFS